MKDKNKELITEYYKSLVYIGIALSLSLFADAGYDIYVNGGTLKKWIILVIFAFFTVYIIRFLKWVLYNRDEVRKEKSDLIIFSKALYLKHS